MENTFCKVDLHIHSKASEYIKGDKDIVQKSDINNLDVLIKKLNDNEINLISVTDHNRFDYDLFSGLRNKINSSPQKSLENNLPGVEFTVKLEEDKDPCHVIAIFDDADNEKLKSIEKNIYEIKKITNEKDFYLIDEFERVIKNIGINTILIVHQKQSLNNKNPGHKSMSSATSDPYVFLKIGYFDCMEFNTPKVEGMIRNNLQEVNLSYPLITGSDCHEWEAYPKHDENSMKGDKNFTVFKCLPTFKGLLMSITSFDTRANRNINTNQYYINNLLVNGKEHRLVNGINAIIGDNGAGKSLIASVLADQVDDHYKKLIKENNIYAQYVSPTGTNKQTVVEKIKFIKQGSVSSNVSDGKLFKEDGNFYKTIPTLGSFSEQINQYYDELISFIQFQIGKKRKYDSLSEHYFEITTTNSIAMFYPSIVINLNQENNTDNDEKRLQTMTNLYDEINNEYKKNRKYYISLHAEETIEQVVKLLASIIDTIKAVLAKKKISNQCKQIVSNALRNLSVNLNKKRSSEEQKQQQRISARESLISSVVDYYSTVINELDFPSFPQAIKGESINSNFGYTFFQTARYHEKNLKNDFYKFCFNKDYQNEEAIKSIETEDQLSQALAYYSSDNVVEFKNSKVNKFIQEYSRTTTKITDDFSLSVGNTPGEVAKVFYKFITTQMKEQYHVLIIDQPEDDINPKGIQTMLNEFLGSIRDSKQVILITHSPLLVVNLDVDNVIYVNKEGQSISIEEGPLEFVNNKYSILDLVRDNLDGGYDAIKRRLKVYDDDNN